MPSTLSPEQMAAMDDMAHFGQRVTERDLDRRIAEKSATCADGCRGDCAQGRKPCEWSAPHRLHDWTEVLPETCSSPVPRMGPLSSMERRLLQRTPTYTWAGITLFAVFAALVRGCWA